MANGVPVSAAVRIHKCINTLLILFFVPPVGDQKCNEKNKINTIEMHKID